MDELERILDLNNDIETSLLVAVLKEKGIPHLVKTNHDTAYDGIIQVMSGWGYLEAPASYRGAILEIFNDVIRDRAKAKIVESGGAANHDKADEDNGQNSRPEALEGASPQKRSRFSIAAFLGFLLLVSVMGYLLIDNGNLNQRLDAFGRLRPVLNGQITYVWDEIEKTDLGYYAGTKIIASRFLDTDNDGAYDVVRLWDRRGEFVGEKIDADKNGSFETLRQGLPGGDTAIWIDADDDGLSDKVEIHKTGAAVRTLDIKTDILGFPR